MSLEEAGPGLLLSTFQPFEKSVSSSLLSGSEFYSLAQAQVSALLGFIINLSNFPISPIHISIRKKSCGRDVGASQG